LGLLACEAGVWALETTLLKTSVIRMNRLIKTLWLSSKTHLVTDRLRAPDYTYPAKS
jgi:hypothetical protein